MENIFYFYIMRSKKVTTVPETTAKIIRYLNTGIFPATVLFSMGFDYDGLMKHLKKAGDWAAGIQDNKHVKEGKSWLGIRADVVNNKTGEARTYFYIILPRAFDLTDDEDYIKLSHEVLHICQFALPDWLDRDREFECEAYLHSHLMRQCLKEIRLAYCKPKIK
jgi:hypothetical protein